MSTRKFLCLLLVLVFVTAFSLPAFAEADAPKVVDEAGLLTQQEQAALERKCLELSCTYQMDVVILTNDSLGGKSSEAFADDYFDYNGYGIGEKASGILLLVSMEERDWAISTCGGAIYAVTDYGNALLADAMLSGLSDGDYYDAFEAYLEELEYLFRECAKGTPVDAPSRHAGSASRLTAGKILLCVAAAAAIGGIVTFTMRRQMNTAVPQNQANAYIANDSFHLTTSQDIFLYSTLSKTLRQQNNTGGSSAHISSSGRSHGGSHGKF